MLKMNLLYPVGKQKELLVAFWSSSLAMAGILDLFASQANTESYG